MEHAQENEDLMSACVGHTLAHGGSIAMRRTTIGAEDAGFCVRLINLVEQTIKWNGTQFFFFF